MSLTVFDILDRVGGSAQGQRPALTYAGEVRTFAQLRTRSLQAAGALRGVGVGPGDRVGLMLGNRHEWMELFFAIAAVGAECVPVKLTAGPAGARDVLADLDVRCLVVDGIGSEILFELEELPDLVIAIGPVERPPGRRTVRYEEALAQASGRPGGDGPLPGAPFITHHTSGTARESLPVTHTHAGVAWNALHQIADLGLRSGDRYLVTPSLAHGSGVHDLLLPLLWIGGHGVLMPTGGLTIERLVAAVEDHAITHVLLVPSLLARLLASPAHLGRLRSSTLRVILTGADAVPPVLAAELAAELPGCAVIEGYGLAEFPTLAAVARPEHAARLLGSAGTASSITTLRVRDEDGALHAVGEGEIVLRSPATAAGYRGRERATAESFVAGWLRTGDDGRLDEDGVLTVLGRRAERIERGGAHVWPARIENALLHAAGVGEAAAVAVQADLAGTVPVVVVAPRRGECVDGEALAIAAERLAGVERPAAVLVREEPLPRNADGKLVRRRLAMWARRWLPRLTESGPIPVRSVPEPARPPGRSRVARDDA